MSDDTEIDTAADPACRSPSSGSPSLPLHVLNRIRSIVFNGAATLCSTMRRALLYAATTQDKRVAFAVAVGGFWLINTTQNMLTMLPDPSEEEKIGDLFFDVFRPVNKALHTHPQLARLLTILTSGSIDLLLLQHIYLTIFKTGLTVNTLSLIGTMLLRQVNQVISRFPARRNMIWGHPGVPSLSVCYATTNDFWFSGHTAFTMYVVVELWRHHPFSAAAFSVLQIGFLLATYAHYWPDIYGAIATYFALLFGLRLALGPQARPCTPPSDPKETAQVQ